MRLPQDSTPHSRAAHSGTAPQQVAQPDTSRERAEIALVSAVRKSAEERRPWSDSWRLVDRIVRTLKTQGLSREAELECAGFVDGLRATIAFFGIEIARLYDLHREWREPALLCAVEAIYEGLDTRTARTLRAKQEGRRTVLDALDDYFTSRALWRNVKTRDLVPDWQKYAWDADEVAR